MPTKADEHARPATPPDSSNLSTVRHAAEHCTACHLYKRATQTVFGEGPKKASIMLVGEQPGDYEDLAGKPFVGPAGKIMDRALEEAACRPWLEAELRLVRPKLLVVLGATAGQAIFGPSFRVTRERGKVLSSKFAPKVVATVHPSSLLRQPDEESRRREYKNFVADLRVAVKTAGAA